MQDPSHTHARRLLLISLGFLTDPQSVTDVGEITINVGMASVPEPGVLALLAMGLVAMGIRRKPAAG